MLFYHRLSETVRPYLSRRTVRLRLTLVYGGLFLLSGAGLVAIINVLVRRATVGFIFQGEHAGSFSVTGTGSARPGGPGGSQHLESVPGLTPQQAQAQAEQLQAQAHAQHAAELQQLLVQSGIALGIMAAASIVLGWCMSGRVLRPLRTMTAATRQISEDSLHERLAVQGPKDELKDLGDTIDGLLDRLDNAFDAQRQFVANASHELRTPLTLARTLLQITLTDPNATVDTFRSTCQEVLAAGEQQELLIEALLTLARSQRGLADRELLDLAVVTGDVLRAQESDAARRGLTVDASLDGAPVLGDAQLLKRLVSNLVENAQQYNVPDGRMAVRVELRSGQPVLRVTNSGPLVPADDVQRLLLPFQRLGVQRAGPHAGLGLGLSVVAAIARAHHAALRVRPGPEGGLDVSVAFPPLPDPNPYA